MCKCIVLAGPTAVGKTDISIKLAKRLNASIISADASQVYKYLDIGTAKISREQMQGINHYMIDIIEPDAEYSVGLYYNQVNKILNENDDLFIITGGTGLYLDSITQGLTIMPEVDSKLRLELESKSIDELIELLDGDTKDIDLKNKRRIIRKIETKGIEYNNIKGNSKEFIKIFLTRDRQVLYDRINKRVDIMIESGLIEEARKMYEKYKNIKAIGYKELFMYFDGTITLQEAIEKIKTNSRRYAKRQFTWFKNKGYIELNLDKLNEEQIIERICSIYGAK